MGTDLKEATERKSGYGELHLHLDGAITPDIAKKLAVLQGIRLPYEGEQLSQVLSVGEDCQSLNEFLQCFDLPLKLLQTKEGISEAVFLVQEELKTEGLSYAELRFAPQLHCQGGLSQAQVIEAALDGLKRSTLPCNLILCCMRGNGNERANEETMELTGEYVKKRILADGRKGYGVAAMDLAGAEALYPTYKYKELFKKAADRNIPFTIHAGEAGGAAEVCRQQGEEKQTHPQTDYQVSPVCIHQLHKFPEGLGGVHVIDGKGHLIGRGLGDPVGEGPGRTVCQ